MDEPDETMSLQRKVATKDGVRKGARSRQHKATAKADSKKAQQSLETRERLLDAAEELFAHYGLYGVTVRNVSDHVGVDSALIPYYFGTKRGMFDAVFERRSATINAARMAAMDAYEAGARGKVTVEGATRALPLPFFVIATQNPYDQLGTYALPESQLDRFLMRLSIGYPDRGAERSLLAGVNRRDLVGELPPLLNVSELHALQQAVGQVHVSDSLLDYLQDLVDATRSGQWFQQGLSPRAAIAVLRAARAQALLAGRDYVAPDDVQAILPQCVAHRLIPVASSGRGAVEQVRALIDALPLP